MSGQDLPLQPPASDFTGAGARLLAAELVEGGWWRIHMVLGSGQQGHLLMDGDGYRTTPVQELAQLLEAQLAGRRP